MEQPPVCVTWLWYIVFCEQILGLILPLAVDQSTANMHLCDLGHLLTIYWVGNHLSFRMDWYYVSIIWMSCLVLVVLVISVLHFEFWYLLQKIDLCSMLMCGDLSGKLCLHLIIILGGFRVWTSHILCGQAIANVAS